MQISADKGLEALTLSLGTAETQLCVSPSPLLPRLARWVWSHEAKDRPSDPVATPPISDASQGLEAQVLAVFRSTLGHKTLGPADDFFDAGGDSLLVSQALRGLQQALPDQLSQRLRIEDLMATPSSAEALAATLQARVEE